MISIAWQPWPKAGDIVNCRFPEEVGQPGPKERPALVLQVEESTEDSPGCVVVVAYATTQKTSKVYQGEFVIEKSAISGLTADTKFDLINRHALPFDSRWFGPAPGTTPPYPRRGRLDLQDLAVKKKLHSAILASEALRRN